jgi:hypothetical protein
MAHPASSPSAATGVDDHRRQLRRAVVAGTLLMGIATFLVALVSTFESIGIWGAVLLTLLRFVQGVGLFAANLAVLASTALTGDQFLVWGWRIPFVLSLALVGVGLYVRLGIRETLVFARLSAARRIERAPVAEVFRRHPGENALTALCRMGE